MTLGIVAEPDHQAFDRNDALRRLSAWAAPSVLALAASAALGVWVLYLHPVSAPDLGKLKLAASRTAAAPGSRPEDPYGDLVDPGFSSAPTLTANGGVDAALASAAPAAPPQASPNPFGDLVDPGFTSGSPPPSIPRSAPAAPNLASLAPQPLPPTPSAPPAPVAKPAPQFSPVAPLPPPRPADLGPAAGRPTPRPERVPQSEHAVASAPTQDNRNFFERLFGSAAPSKPSAPVVAYASPETTVVHSAVQSAVQSAIPSPPPVASAPVSARYDRYTAVYDISAHVVYLPDGRRLEAHSGYGDKLDDPTKVNVRMYGATPPNVYELSPREQLFHGVAALRLKPVGGGELYGRAGLLAHPFMLGPNGDSNGCVSVKDYDAFLQAYQAGQVKRLAVVARMD